MMFAVTIGEVGLQFAPLVNKGDVLHWLPAYTHILLATVVIATSWIGWSQSVSPGARRDMDGVFQWEFFLLLLDVSMVIGYFVLVRAVNFEEAEPQIASSIYVTNVLVAIFILYLVWDFVTKVLIYRRDRKRSGEVKPWRPELMRGVPTVFCLLIAWLLQRLAASAGGAHRITIDVALLSTIVLFRALKEIVSVLVPREEPATARAQTPLWVVKVWTIVSVTGLVCGTVAAMYSSLMPGFITRMIS